MSGKMFVAKQDASDVYSMFGIEKATAVKVGDTIYATVYVNPPKSGVFTYSYMYFGTRTALIAQLDAGGKFDVVGASGVDSDLNKQIYHFTLPADKAGTRVPICVLKSDLTAKSPYNSSELELMVPADIPEGKVTPVPTPKDYPAAPATERDVTGLAVVDRETSAVYADFTITSATGIKVNGQTYLTALVKADEAGNFPYSYLYFGTLEQLKEQLDKGGAFDVVGYAANGEMRSYHFTLSADELDDTLRVPVCLLKADLKAENAYNTTELVLTIPEGIEEKNSEAAKAIPTLPDDLSEAGIKVVKADGTEFKMFTAKKTGMVIAGDKLWVRFETPNPSFSRLYFGSKEDGFKSPYVQGKETATGGWVFEFELPASYRGANNSICLGKPDGTWYTGKDLLIAIPADTGDTAVVRDDAGIIMAPTSSWTQVSFVIGESSAMLLKDRIYITITGKMGGTEAGKTAAKLYLGSRNDADKSGCIIGTVNEDGTTTFSFSVSADKQGTSILAVAGYADGSWHTNQDFFLNIPNFSRGFDLSYYTDGVYDLYGNAYAYLDKVDNRGLAVDDGSTLTVSGDQITIKWVTRASDTDKLYFGQLSDDAAAREAQAITSTDAGTLNWKVFTITLPKSALSTMIPFMRHSPLWFQDTNGWLEKQDYLVLMNCLPRIGDLPDDTGTTIDPAGMKMLSGGSEVEQMFVITASSATLRGDTITCTITGRTAGNNSGKTADKLYLGSRFDKDKTSYITGTVNGDGTTTFVFDVSADKQGTSIPVVIGHTDGGWDATQDYFLNIPNFDGSFDLSYYTDGVYDLYGNAYAELSRTENKSFPVDKGSTLSISGDKIVIKWVCRSGSYDKVYFGLASDDEATRNAGAVAFEDYAGEATWKVYTVTLSKSALSARIPFARHSTKWYTATNGWLTTQDYLVLANRLPKLSSTPDIPVDPTDPTDPSKPSGEIEDGYYQVTTECSASMFKIIDAKLKVVNGKMTAELTLSGTGYDYLYAGTGEEAKNDKNNWAPFTVNADGKYVYTIPVSELDKEITISSHSEKNNKWYDRTVTFLSASLKKIGDVDPTDPTEPTTPTDPTEPTTPTDPTTPTSPSEPDTSGSTSKVDNSTTLKDGEYKPDGFTFSGGSGRVKIVCDKVIVKGGKAYAVIRFVSTSGSQTEYKHVKASGGVFYPTSDGKFTIPVALNANNRILGMTSKMSAAHEIEYILNIQLKDGKPIDPTEPTDPTDPSEPGGEIEDGYYQVTTKCSASMFKIIDAKLKVVNGQMTAELTLSGTGYDYLYAGTKEQAAKDKANWAPFTENADGKYVYTVPVSALDEPLNFASHSKKNDEWYDRVVTFLSAGLKKIGDVDPSEPSGEIKDGYYQVTTECSASMFKIIDAKLKVVNGKMTAELTLSGTGYDYLYAGTGKEAENDKDNWAPFTVNADGKYVYTIPVSELDKEITISSHSKKNDEWYDRVVKFLSASLKKIGDVDPTDPTDPTTPTDPTAPTTPTDPTTPTSPSEPDTSGSTSKVDNSTTLKDGEYKPDGFTFSGGSGRVKIVCDKVIVKGGKAYAVIRFVSTSGSQTEYKHVKASGGVFYPTSDGKFTIPVALNANNRILGMTSKMSAAHEIEYSIYVQLKKAQSATSTGSGGGGSLSTEEEEKDDPDSKLDKTAPEILGLEFKENIKTSGARYLKLFQYDQGVVLAEVDLRRDTVLDTDEAAKALAQADKEAKEAPQTVQSDEPADTAQITSDYVAAQYQGDILKYLLVPAGVELPAGLEKDYLIVSVPASNVYLMDETLAGTLDQLGALKNVSVLPEDCEDATLYDMLETGEKLPGGTWEKPDYRTLIKEKVALGLIGTEPLPLSEQTLTERKETVPEREELTAVEYRDRLTKLTDRFAVLDIPLVVDRSADEPEARGQAAWLKLYGILFGKQDAAGKLYDAAIAKEDNA